MIFPEKTLFYQIDMHLRFWLFSPIFNFFPGILGK